MTGLQTLEQSPIGGSLDARSALVSEVWHGLRERPRSLVPWMFYDAEGSRLFEQITTLPEYYPTRIERKLLVQYASKIICASGSDPSRPLRIVELGAGTAVKTGILLKAAARVREQVVYLPIDVSAAALEFACDSIGAMLPNIKLEPMVANYVTHPPALRPFEGPTLVVYLGTSIGNFSAREARAILRNLRSELRRGDALLLGTDMVKAESVLVRAYDDAAGVTASFNLNILRRLNRELGANFEIDQFRHVTRWNGAESRIEMHLQSTCDQWVDIPEANLRVQIATGETIHTESSYKFTRKTLCDLLDSTGFAIAQVRTDPLRWYSLTLAQVR
jgi:dimethylhistidine N-methyltransferase